MPGPFSGLQKAGPKIGIPIVGTSNDPNEVQSRQLAQHFDKVMADIQNGGLPDLPEPPPIPMPQAFTPLPADLATTLQGNTSLDPFVKRDLMTYRQSGGRMPYSDPSSIIDGLKGGR